MIGPKILSSSSTVYKGSPLVVPPAGPTSFLSVTLKTFISTSGTIGALESMASISGFLPGLIYLGTTVNSISISFVFALTTFSIG